MGQSCFPKTLGPYLALAWLFVACSFLLLTPGDAFQCRYCRSFMEGQVCLPFRRYCDVDGDQASCVLLKHYTVRNNILEKRFLFCAKYGNPNCGKTQIIEGIREETLCCATDKCNERLK